MTPDTERVDYQAQIQRLDALIQAHGDRVRIGHHVATDLPARGEGRPSVVVGDAVAAELGRPEVPSHALVLTTTRSELVHDGRIRWVGPDLDEADPSRQLPIAQVVLVAHAPEARLDPFELQVTGFLANRLPGYMVRTVPGRLWVRVSREAVASGLGLEQVGAALVAAYRDDFQDVRAAEAVMATDRDFVDALATIAAEIRVLSGQHKKLVLKERGVYECEDLDCDACDEQEVCDALRDVTVRYRNRRAG